MSWLNERQIADLLREAARRGRVRAEELAEAARETYGSGPKARFSPKDGTAPLYFRESIQEYESLRAMTCPSAMRRGRKGA